MSNALLLQVENLSVGFAKGSGVVAVTEGVSFSVARGESYALVGESGCGKSVTAMSLLGLLPRPSARVLAGRALFHDQDLLTRSPQQLAQIRGSRIGVIFQEPGAALNPVRTIGSQLDEVRNLAARIAVEAPVPISAPNDWLRRTGIADPARVLAAYPHELSGGMLQRVIIAMALLAGPELIIADEPTTALDVTVQAQVMEILATLCAQEGVALLLITHNLGLVSHYAHRMGVMYAGHLVEEGPVAQILAAPAHPYTEGLLAAMPVPGKTLEQLRPIAGMVPRPGEYGAGCRYAGRCSKAQSICATLPERKTEGPRQVLCHFPGGAYGHL